VLQPPEQDGVQAESIDTPTGATVAHWAYRPLAGIPVVPISSEPPELDDPHASLPVHAVVSPFVDHKNASPEALYVLHA
jgi:hypothetical protein